MALLVAEVAVVVALVAAVAVDLQEEALVGAVAATSTAMAVVVDTIRVTEMVAMEMAVTVGPLAAEEAVMAVEAVVTLVLAKITAKIMAAAQCEAVAAMVAAAAAAAEPDLTVAETNPQILYYLSLFICFVSLVDPNAL